MTQNVEEIPDAKPPIEWVKVWETLAKLPKKRIDVLAAINGVSGDALEERESKFAISMSLRDVKGQELDLNVPLADQIEQPRSRIIVLVHSLMTTENVWTFPMGKGRCIGERLALDEDVTPVYVRYNTGRHISLNGRELAQQLERLVNAWPVPIESFNLLGYSMGGLVSRSATHYGRELEHAWIEKLERLFLLGAPLRGAPLEQLTNITTMILRSIPTIGTQITGWILKARSDGIKDLRHGYLVDEEWCHRNQDRLSFGRQHAVPLIEGVKHYVIAGNLFEDEHHPLAKIFGDALVAPFSAKDEGIDGTPSERTVKQTRIFPGLGHLALANHDDVYTQILEWWREAERDQ